MTLHRLLGWQRGSSSRFKYNATNRLPYDVVVVDETSMVSLTLMARLLEAVRPDARLLLVGDPDQLTSVDAGAVLADLVARPVEVSGNPALTQLVGDDITATGSEEALSADEQDRLRGGIIQLSRGRRFDGTIASLARQFEREIPLRFCVSCAAVIQPSPSIRPRMLTHCAPTSLRVQRW